MPLQYIIDAYNIINHAAFISIRKKIRDPQRALLDSLKIRSLAKKHKITVVFDGYPKFTAQKLKETGIDIIYSKEETADAIIKRMVDSSKNPKNIVVVSDDRDIKFFIKSAGASPCAVEEFIKPEVKQEKRAEDLIKPELNFSQISRINQELRELWLNKK